MASAAPVMDTPCRLTWTLKNNLRDDFPLQPLVVFRAQMNLQEGTACFAGSVGVSRRSMRMRQYWAAAEFYCAGLQHAEMDIIASWHQTDRAPWAWAGSSSKRDIVVTSKAEKASTMSHNNPSQNFNEMANPIAIFPI